MIVMGVHGLDAWRATGNVRDPISLGRMVHHQGAEDPTILDRHFLAAA